MSLVASVRMSRLLVSKVSLAEFIISPRTSDVITTKRLATRPTTLRVSPSRSSAATPVLLKTPRSAAPNHGQQNEQSNDKPTQLLPRSHSPATLDEHTYTPR